jgi:anti-sigma regulatory factor (Ser/Thr protein kinase)
MPTARFAADLSSAEHVRRFVDAGLRPAAVDEETLFLTQLLATELVTNAVRHARSPVDLTVDRRNGVIRIEARDRSTVTPAMPQPETPTRHRGMLLVEDLSEAWGVDVQDAEGKVVWCEVPAA